MIKALERGEHVPVVAERSEQIKPMEVLTIAAVQVIIIRSTNSCSMIVNSEVLN